GRPGRQRVGRQFSNGWQVRGDRTGRKPVHAARRKRSAVPLQRRQTLSAARGEAADVHQIQREVMTNPPNVGQAREEAVRDWERETDNAAGAGRQFSGEGLKRVVNGDWFTKIG